jgi:hypothetical protein
VKKTLLRTAVAATIAMAALAGSAPAFADAPPSVSTSSTTSDSATLTGGEEGGSVTTSSTTSDSATVVGPMVDDDDSCYYHWTELSWKAQDACDDSFDA